MLPEELVERIRKYAIKNAIDYGTARADNVIGKVIRGVPKGETNELKSEVARIVKEINSMGRKELDAEYERYKEEFDLQHEKKAEATSKPRMELDGAVTGDFVTRFAPEPSGYLHIGHASAAFLAQEFAKIYKGKAILYFDDTNPEKESQEFVDAIKRDLDWLGIEFDKERYASDNMGIIYDCARKLISLGKAYACECKEAQIKASRLNGTECQHRDASGTENLRKFEKMLADEYEEGRIIIRFKGNMKSQNTALRDPTMLRVKKDEHFRQKSRYVVWPTYDFNTPINDSINGVTDAIRTKEYELRNALYDMVLEYLEMKKPRLHLHARISIAGQPKQKREIRRMISDRILSGYDDPRLVTLAALRRRGVQPGAIREFVLSFGMSKVESIVEITPLLAYNKRIIDPLAKRLYYVPGPVDIELDTDKKFDAEMKLHPTEDLGKRKYTVAKKLYISGEDASGIKEGEVIGLKGLFNLRVRKGDDSLIGTVVDSEGAKKLQWVSDGNFIKCSVLVPGEIFDKRGDLNMDSLRTNMGYIETYATNLNEHEIVQLERFGYCILDDKKAMRFILISR